MLATSGSVKVTCGTASWSAVATCLPHGASSTGSPFARAAITIDESKTTSLKCAMIACELRWRAF